MSELSRAGAGIGMTSDRTRGRMVEVLRKGGITDERVLAAMLEGLMPLLPPQVAAQLRRA